MSSSAWQLMMSFAIGADTYTGATMDGRAMEVHIDKKNAAE